MRPQLEKATNIRALTGESPVWCDRDRVLWWVDIAGKKLIVTDPADGRSRALHMASEAGCVGLSETGPLIAGLRDGWYEVDPGDGRTRCIAQPEGKVGPNRFNDGTAGPAGRFWSGTMPLVGPGGPASGHIYRLDADGGWERVLSGFTIPNGMAFSPDGRRFYLSDSSPKVRMIWQFDHDPASGLLSNCGVFFDTRSVAGRPDGGAIDSDGCYWMAGVTGGHLLRLTPSGRIDMDIEMPVSKPTKIAFGGRDLSDIYVTSISRDIDLATEPEAGALFVFRIPGVQGLPAQRFGGFR